jgi:hypothetical protein
MSDKLVVFDVSKGRKLPFLSESCNLARDSWLYYLLVDATYLPIYTLSQHRQILIL